VAFQCAAGAWLQWKPRGLVAIQRANFAISECARSPIDRVEAALQFLFRKNLVSLGMTGPADSHHLSHSRPIKLAFIPLVVMAGVRNQVVRSAFLRAGK
jgi:hypothetical protein